MTARNRLTRLRKRGLIDFALDSARRGANVSYVRTAKLDALGEDGQPSAPPAPVTSRAAAPVGGTAVQPGDRSGQPDEPWPQSELPFGP